jgi:hypothetical protein
MTATRDPQRRNLGCCNIFNKAGRRPHDLKESIDARISQFVITDASRWPTTDFYVQTAKLTAKSEMAAASMGAIPVVMPEGLHYLLNAIDKKCFAGEDVWLYIPSKAGICCEAG